MFTRLFCGNRDGKKAPGGKDFKAESGEPAAGSGEEMLSLRLRPQAGPAEDQWAPQTEGCAQRRRKRVSNE